MSISDRRRSWERVTGIRRIADKLWHVLYGIHSRIPLCCVWHFVTRNERALAAEWGYAPCDSCRVAGRRVDLHYCDPFRRCARLVRAVQPALCEWRLTSETD